MTRLTEAEARTLFAGLLDQIGVGRGDPTFILDGDEDWPLFARWGEFNARDEVTLRVEPLSAAVTGPQGNAEIRWVLDDTATTYTIRGSIVALLSAVGVPLLPEPEKV